MTYLDSMSSVARLLVACCLFLAAPPVSGSAASANTSDLVLALDWSSIQRISHRIPGNFFGLSLEWCNPLHLIGPDLSHPHTSFHNVFPYLSTREGVGPTLRVGGSSSDRSWYNPLSRPQPQWEDFVANITDDTYIALDRVSRLYNTSIIAGVSFRLAYNGSIFAPEVAAMTRVVDADSWGTRWSIEIGNEQELYDACGSHPYETYRPCGWGWDNFTVEYDWEVEAITQLLPYTFDGKVFQGGAFCCPYFQSRMAAWTIERASHFSSLSFHRYIWNGGGDYPTLDQFLSDYASLAGLQQPLGNNVTLPSAIAEVHAAIGPHFPVYLGEGNSVGDEGMAGITDTFAQVVWLVDYAMALSSFNVSGFHMYVGWTDPSTFLAGPFVWPDPARDEVTVHPTLYGMWMFAFATWNGARIVDHQRVHVSDASNATKSWTLVDDDGNLVLLLIRKDQQQVNVTVTLQLSGVETGYDGHFIEASAPNVTSKTGLSMADLTWQGTTNGLPVATTSARHQSATVKPRVSRERGSEAGSGNAAAVVMYDLLVRPASVLAVVIPTSDDQGASWQRRVSTILRVNSEATPVPVE